MGYHQLNQTKMLKAGDSIPTETLLTLKRETWNFRVFFASNSPAPIPLS